MRDLGSQYELGRQTFVLQRRINNCPMVQVTRTIRNAASFGAGKMLSSRGTGVLRLDEPFVRLDVYAEPTWRAPGRLVGRYERAARVELEISAWSDTDTELLLRPLARNPLRWSGRRLRRYFLLAHQGADDLTELLVAITATDPADPARERGLANA